MAVVNLAVDLGQTETQVHILIAIPKGCVEPARLIEIRAAYQEAGARDSLEPSRSVHCRVIAGKACVQMTGLAVFTDRESCVLDRVVRK